MIAGESDDYCPCGLLDSFGRDILNNPCQQYRKFIIFVHKTVKEGNSEA